MAVGAWTHGEPFRVTVRPRAATEDGYVIRIGTEVETMRTTRPSIALGAFFILAVAALAACGSSAAAPVLSTVGNAVDDSQYGAGAGQRAAASAAPAEEPSSGPVPGSGGVPVVDDTKIVRTGSIQLQVKDVTTVLETARDGIRAMGGYIGSSETTSQDDHPVATVTYRIPVDRWEDALDLLHNLAGQTTKILDERTQAVEVTGAVVDLQARIKNLQASEASLQAIAGRAAKISDVLEVQAQLTTVRGEIEELSAQLKDLNDRSSYATLSASFATPIVAVQVAQDRWEPAKVVDLATASLVDILQSLTTAGIWFAIVWLPILLVFGIVVAVVLAVLRRLGVVGRGRPDAGVPATT
jgi:hypothetical protein